VKHEGGAVFPLSGNGPYYGRWQEFLPQNLPDPDYDEVEDILDQMKNVYPDGDYTFTLTDSRSGTGYGNPFDLPALTAGGGPDDHPPGENYYLNFSPRLAMVGNWSSGDSINTLTPNFEWYWYYHDPETPSNDIVPAWEFVPDGYLFDMWLQVSDLSTWNIVYSVDIGDPSLNSDSTSHQILSGLEWDHTYRMSLGLIFYRQQNMNYSSYSDPAYGGPPFYINYGHFNRDLVTQFDFTPQVDGEPPSDPPEFPPVPEPAYLALLSIAALELLGYRWRRKRRQDPL
jgi:hypothetical protein